MNIIQIIQQLENTNSRIEKEQILYNAFISGHREFFIGAKMAYDNLVTFGVQKVAFIEDEFEPEQSSTFNDFLVLCSKLQKRELTGHAARDAIFELAENTPTAIWNSFYRRVLLKDLKIGIEAKTINKVLNKLSDSYPETKNYVIPIFGLQLAEDGNLEKHTKKIKGKKLIDCKFDGCRLITILDKENNSVSQYTRNGRVNENFPDITKSLYDLMQELPGSIALDGEVIGKDFQSLMTQMNRKDDINTSNNRLMLFDIIPLNDFRSGFCKTTQRERHMVLTLIQETGLLKKHCGSMVAINPKIEIDFDTEQGRKSYDDFVSMAIANGNQEGAMIKDPEAPYHCRRTDAWLKAKPFIEVTLEIVSIEIGKNDGKYGATTGALLCHGTHDNKEINVLVGSGLSDELRDELWNNQEKYIGMMVEIRADAITIEKNSSVYSLRFPRFKGFRGIEKGEIL